jgi:ribosome-associated heat shock protein Hsp15
VAAEDRRRIDKWLWYARLAKSRTLAQGLAVSGRVRVNSEKNQSASRPLKVGDVLTVALESGVRVLKVAGLGERRGPASEAVLLYEDLTPPAPPDAKDEGRAGPRPTKRDRRRLVAARAVGAGEDFPPDDEAME